jgi:hypothetical protein
VLTWCEKNIIGWLVSSVDLLWEKISRTSYWIIIGVDLM